MIFGLSLASSSSELMNARMRSLESSPSPGSMVLLSYSSLPLSSVSLLSVLALLSFYVNVLAFLSVGWPAVRGTFCSKHERLSIAFAFSLLLLFKWCFSPWCFKYTRLVLEHVVFEASLHLRTSQSFSFAFSSAIFFLLNFNTSFVKT